MLSDKNIKKFFLFCLIFIIILILYLINNHKTNIQNDNISIEDKISQMFVIGYSNRKAKSELLKYISQNQISGIIFYKKNIKSPKKIQNDIKLFKSKNNTLPLFLMLDQEGGYVSRLSKNNGFKDFPSAKEIGANRTPEEAYEIYYDMAKMIKHVGFNFNLAPCLDIDNKNSDICKDLRCYGNNSENVFKYSNAFIKAHLDNNIITAIKHYPGLGSATNDSHKFLPDISSSWSKEDIKPFEKILQKYPFNPIIIGHSYNSQLDKNNISSLSDKTIGKLNPQGVILIDAIDMSALKNEKLENVIYKAINAGVNLFIFPNHKANSTDLKINITPDVFNNIVKQGIKEEKISIEKINISYEKIKKLKETIREI